ncbi:MAG: molybdopterin converting factor subunit 1 [Pseudomonadota bacterium]
MITILYFASIKEKLGLAKETMELPSDVGQADALLAYLHARGSQWADALAVRPELKIAINQSISTLNAAIKDGDEIAFFPPVTGG